LHANTLIECKHERLPFSDGTYLQSYGPDDPCYNLQTCLVSVEEKKSEPLFTRKHSRAVWDHVYSYLTTVDDSRVIVTGNPGIGNTRSMTYLLKKLLETGKFVVYYAGKITTAFAFAPIGVDGVHGKPLYKAWKSDTFLPHICSALQNPDSYFLIDPAEQAGELPLVQAHTCIAASPNIEFFKGLQKAKQELHNVFLPIWTAEEVTVMYKKLTELKAVHESITAEVFATRLRKFGPNSSPYVCKFEPCS